MRRGAKPTKAKVEAKPSIVRKSSKSKGSRVQDLEERLAEAVERESEARKRESEALEQQTATSEILRVISSSPTDLQPVLNAVVKSAARFCGADDAELFRLDGEHLKVAAHSGPIAAPVGRLIPVVKGSVSGRAFAERRAIHVADLQAEAEEFPVTSGMARELGFRTSLSVPLLREGMAVGTITLRRAEVNPFTDKQIALLQTFADQAVIAIENVRLFHEMKEALEQQTAMSEILRIISSSPTDLQPVFNTIVRSADRLCNGLNSAVYLYDGELVHHVALSDPSPEARVEFARQFPQRPNPELGVGRVVLTGTIAHSADVLGDPNFGEGARRFARLRGFRALLLVPMLRAGRVVGVISVGRAEPGLFPDSQVTLLQTFADQAVIAIQNVRLFKELEARNRDLTEGLERETATGEILRVISASPTDTQPVLEAILDSGKRLCNATFGAVFRFEGDAFILAASTMISSEFATWLRGHPLRPGPGTPLTRAGIDRRPVQVADILADPDFAPPDIYRREGMRTALAVPMLKDDVLLGALTFHRHTVQPFTDQQVALLETFAAQAVIAIENVRLFTELEERNRDLTATAEILRVISSSPTDVQPVFDAIAESAVRLCAGLFGAVFRFDGELMHFVAHHHFSGEALDLVQRQYPRPPRGLNGSAILDRAVAHSPDVFNDPRTANPDLARVLGYRSILAVPILREGQAIGAIVVYGADAVPFPEEQIALLKTFADQALIAIENVRLFTELQASNRELTTALDHQTATSDILRVISQAQRDVQPVFDTIVTSAGRLLRGNACTLSRIEGDQIALAAMTSIDDAGDASQRARFPMSIHSEEDHAQAVRNRAPLNSSDAHSDPRLPETQHASARLRGYRSLVVVPLVRHDEAVGALGVARPEPGGFTDDEIALLRTFADQAVIAIENARLLTELQARTRELTRSVEQLTALGDVGRAVSSSLDLDTVLTTIVGRAVQLSGTDGGTIFEYDEGTEEFVPRATLNADESQSAMLRATRLRRGEGAVGQMAVTREPLQISDIAAKGAYESRLRGALLEAGTRAVLAIPLLHEERIVGGLVVTRRTPGEFTAEVVEILKTFATQSALAIQNARLFHEIERKSRELEVASQHKSEFLANMSHELRTPLNAIIGFSEVLTERMFGELNEKQDEYLKDIYASGQHLLSLINDILDLSKIEAGRMELEATDFDLPSAIDNALTLVRERATRRGITLGRTIDERLGTLCGDERKVKQVLLNLLSNALKFTPEGGRIDVSAGVNNGVAEIAVADTGVGIAPEDQEAVFEEFRQVGTADKKVEGTGLGLALSRKFIELHGGRIWVKSQVGHGSTFTFTLPVRREE